MKQHSYFHHKYQKRVIKINFCITTVIKSRRGKTIAKFVRTTEGLYAFRPPDTYFESVAQEKRLTSPIVKYEHSNVVTTVAENRKGYTSCQYEDAKRAHKLYHILGAPLNEILRRY